MERRCYANEQYSRRECLEISGIPASVADKDLESKVLEILEEIDVPIDPTLVEDCHRLPSKGSSKKFIIKLNGHKGIHRIMSNKTKLVRNGSLRIKLSNESVSTIAHGCDLEKLFPDNSLIEDK